MAHRRDNNTTARLNRALNQRILVSNEQIDPRCTYGYYDILGSTGNLYNVQIHTDPQSYSCTCPDYCKRSLLCKHILFVLVQVLGLEPTQLEDSALVSVRFEERLKRVKQSLVAPNNGVVQKPWEGQECPICLEPLTSDEPIVYCRKTCGNNVHQICLQRWSQQCDHHICPLCRSVWT